MTEPTTNSGAPSTQRGEYTSHRASDGGDGTLETRLSDVDGERGRLVVAGHDIETLAATATFEEVCALLWGRPVSDVLATLREGRDRAFAVLPKLGNALDRSSGMDALRASLAHLDAEAAPPEVLPAWLTGATAVFAAAWLRRRAGAAPIAPDPGATHAADFLRMALGAEAPAPCARALDAYLVTVADHGMNASTYAARVVISTGSDMVSAVVAAIGALKGPLHGGAPGPVLDMLDAVGSPDGLVGGRSAADAARAWIERELEAGRRIMGMGHRIYRVRDPRAAVFERQAGVLATAMAAPGAPGSDRRRVLARLELARAVEEEATAALARRHPERPLKANVEFFTAVLLEGIGLPRESFSPAFALGRVAGWCAHAVEQRERGRLIRPTSRYTGPVASPVALDGAGR
jgi:citrate synthase